MTYNSKDNIFNNKQERKYKSFTGKHTFQNTNNNRYDYVTLLWPPLDVESEQLPLEVARVGPSGVEVRIIVVLFKLFLK